MRTANNYLTVENWNLKHPVGTKVILTKDDKSTVETATRSQAELLGGHTPVIWLEGMSGCWALSRVKAVQS